MNDLLYNPHTHLMPTIYINSYWATPITVPVLYMRKLEFREIDLLLQGHTSSKPHV